MQRLETILYAIDFMGDWTEKDAQSESIHSTVLLLLFIFIFIFFS